MRMTFEERRPTFSIVSGRDKTTEDVRRTGNADIECEVLKSQLGYRRLKVSRPEM
jgi:hypothetical protein